MPHSRSSRISRFLVAIWAVSITNLLLLLFGAPRLRQPPAVPPVR
jgi:hypothetical protein